MPNQTTTAVPLFTLSPFLSTWLAQSSSSGGSTTSTSGAGTNAPTTTAPSTASPPSSGSSSNSGSLASSSGSGTGTLAPTTIPSSNSGNTNGNSNTTGSNNVSSSWSFSGSSGSGLSGSDSHPAALSTGTGSAEEFAVVGAIIIGILLVVCGMCILCCKRTVRFTSKGERMKRLEKKSQAIEGTNLDVLLSAEDQKRLEEEERERRYLEKMERKAEKRREKEEKKRQKEEAKQKKKKKEEEKQQKRHRKKKEKDDADRHSNSSGSDGEGNSDHSGSSSASGSEADDDDEDDGGEHRHGHGQHPILDIEQFEIESEGSDEEFPLLTPGEEVKAHPFDVVYPAATEYSRGACPDLPPPTLGDTKSFVQSERLHAQQPTLPKGQFLRSDVARRKILPSRNRNKDANDASSGAGPLDFERSGGGPRGSLSRKYHGPLPRNQLPWAQPAQALMTQRLQEEAAALAAQQGLHGFHSSSGSSASGDSDNEDGGSSRGTARRGFGGGGAEGFFASTGEGSPLFTPGASRRGSLGSDHNSGVGGGLQASQLRGMDVQLPAALGGATEGRSGFQFGDPASPDTMSEYNIGRSTVLSSSHRTSRGPPIRQPAPVASPQQRLRRAERASRQQADPDEEPPDQVLRSSNALLPRDGDYPTHFTVDMSNYL